MQTADVPADAPTLLAVWMAKRRQIDRSLSWKTFASRIGCSQNGLSHWLHRRRKPNRTFACAIERETGGEVPAAAWDAAAAAA